LRRVQIPPKALRKIIMRNDNEFRRISRCSRFTKAKVCTIKSMKEKYDEEIALLKQAVSEMQQLLKNPQKLIEISHS
jgi:hypothetical protein